MGSSRCHPCCAVIDAQSYSYIPTNLLHTVLDAYLRAAASCAQMQVLCGDAHVVCSAQITQCFCRNALETGVCVSLLQFTGFTGTNFIHDGSQSMAIPEYLPRELLQPDLDSANVSPSTIDLDLSGFKPNM